MIYEEFSKLHKRTTRIFIQRRSTIHKVRLGEVEKKTDQMRYMLVLTMITKVWKVQTYSR